MFDKYFEEIFKLFDMIQTMLLENQQDIQKKYKISD